MSKDYKVSNDGTIFEIKEDGSISKIAKIDENGNISSIDGGGIKSTSKNIGIYWSVIIILFVTTISFWISYADAEDKYSHAIYERNEYKNKYENALSASSSLNSQISNLNSQIRSLRQERDEAQKELSNLKNKVSNVYPLIITNIEVANTYKGSTIETNYGYSIYSYNTMYLKPRIKYTGLTYGYKTLKVKLYKPDGSLSTGSNSNFSYSDSVYLYEGENTCELSGWGNSTKGNWKSGTYRIEIWYENVCLKSKTFTIY